MKQYDPHEVEDRSRLMMAVIISLTIFLAFYFLVDRPRQQAQQERAAAAKQVQAEKQTEVAADDGKLRERTDVMAQSGERLPIKGAKITGSLALKGARLDDILLDGHYKTIAREENVELLSPTGAPGAYYVESGWMADRSGVQMPSSDTVWRLAAGSPRTLESGGKPVQLEWDNGEGLLFTRSIALDENYLFTIRQSMTNNSAQILKVNAYNLIARHGMPDDFKGFFVLHEGPVGFLGDKHIEPNYKAAGSASAINIGWSPCCRTRTSVSTPASLARRANIHPFTRRISSAIRKNSPPVIQPRHRRMCTQVLKTCA
jgi:YidC/Oxa1 family membrane protein insertase